MDKAAPLSPPASTAPPVCFIHIPKTAGTSVIAELSLLVRTFLHIFEGDADPITGEYHYRRLLGAEKWKLSAGEYQLFTGHFSFKELNDVQFITGCAFRYMTFLRDPIERAISAYHYSVSAAHPGSEEMITLFPTIEHYVESPDYQNVYCRQLGLSVDEPLEEIIKRMSGFALVGTVEDYAASMLEAAALLGAVPGRTERLNVGERPESIPEAIRRRIIKLNARDVILYELFSGRRERRKAERAALSNAVEVAP